MSHSSDSGHLPNKPLAKDEMDLSLGTSISPYVVEESTESRQKTPTEKSIPPPDIGIMPWIQLLGRSVSCSAPGELWYLTVLFNNITQVVVALLTRHHHQQLLGLVAYRPSFSCLAPRSPGRPMTLDTSGPWCIVAPSWWFLASWWPRWPINTGSLFLLSLYALAVGWA